MGRNSFIPCNILLPVLKAGGSSPFGRTNRKLCDRLDCRAFFFCWAPCCHPERQWAPINPQTPPGTTSGVFCIAQYIPDSPDVLDWLVHASFSPWRFSHTPRKKFKKMDVISRSQSESFRSSVFLSQNIKKLHIHDTNFIKLLDISFFCAIISLTTPLPATAISDGTKHYEESGGYQYE